MHKRNIFLIALVLLSIQCIQTTNCPIEIPKNIKFKSQHIILSTAPCQYQINTKSTNQQFSLPYDDTFSRQPNIALALQGLECDQTSNLSLAAVSVNDPSGSKLPLMLNTPWDKTNWKTLKLNYLATDRDDIEIGQASLGMDNTNKSAIYYNFKNPSKYSVNASLITKPFISGFDVSSLQWAPVGMKTESATYNSTTAWARISGYSKAILNNVTGTFVIFDPRTVGFLFSEGFIEQNFLSAIIKIEVPSNSIKSFESYLVGLSSFSFDATNTISFTSDMNNNFVLQIGPIYTTTINYIGFHYLIIAHGICSECIGHPIFFNNTCLSECPFGTVVRGGECVKVSCPPNSSWDGVNCFCDKGFQNFKSTCIQCPVNNVFDNTSDTGCVCIQGYNKINGTCTACGSNSFFNGTGCQCNQGYYIINGQCDNCKKGQQWYTEYNKCGLSCGQNSKFDGNTCPCNPGFNLINGVCDTCPSDKYWDSNNCVSYCSINEQWTGSTCNCINGTYRIDGVCDFCKPNSVWNGYACVCTDSFYDINCKCQKCPNNRVWNPVSKQCNLKPVSCSGLYQVSNGYFCVCQDGFTKQNGLCTSQCPANSVYINGQCVCNAGYVAQDNQCNLIPPPTSPTPPTPSIVPPQVYCGANSYWNGASCVCNYGYNMIGGVCVYQVLNSCSTNQFWNGFTCVCNIGYTYTNGYCIASPVNPTNCPQNTYWNGLSCACNAGYNMVGGVCVIIQTCPQSMIWSGSSCVCPSGLILIGSSCQIVQTCPQSAYWNGFSCVCNTGYYMSGNICVVVPSIQCGPNAYSNGVCCVCQSGYFKTQNNICVSCPSNTYWNGVNCITNQQIVCKAGCNWNGQWCQEAGLNCVANSRWDGVRCVCNQGFYNVSNYCIQCPQGTYYNGFACTCAPVVNQCGSNQIWNGVSCVCSNGFYMINGQCLSCPAGTAWSGSCCISSVIRPDVCGANQQWIFNSCQCIPGFYPNGNGCTSICHTCG